MTVTRDFKEEEIKVSGSGTGTGTGSSKRVKTASSTGTDWRLIGVIIGGAAFLTTVIYYVINQVLRLLEYQHRDAERKQDMSRVRSYEQTKKH